MLTNAVLCVDDRDSCSNLSDILSDIGYQVDVAYNMSDAVDAMTRKNYPVGVFTFGTPEVDGVQLWKQMNNGRGKHACVMLMEEMLSADLSDAVRTLGERCLLIKPIDVARMIAFIDNAAGQPMQVSEIKESLVPESVREQAAAYLSLHRTWLTHWEQSNSRGEDRFRVVLLHGNGSATYFYPLSQEVRWAPNQEAIGWGGN